MSLIFDRFPSRRHAESFALEVERKFARSFQIFDNEDDAFEHDPVPFRLQAPIVHIGRRNMAGEFDFKNEPKIMALVRNYGGCFVGT